MIKCGIIRLTCKIRNMNSVIGIIFHDMKSIIDHKGISRVKVGEKLEYFLEGFGETRRGLISIKMTEIATINKFNFMELIKRKAIVKRFIVPPV